MRNPPFQALNGRGTALRDDLDRHLGPFHQQRQRREADEVEVACETPRHELQRDARLRNPPFLHGFQPFSSEICLFFHAFPPFEV